MCNGKLASCSLFCVCLVLFWRRIPKLEKQKAHLREVRLQLSKKQHKTGETETVIQNPTDTKSLSVVEDQSTTSGLASQVQGSGDSCSSDTEFNPEEALINNPAAMFEDFTTDWVTSLQGWPICPLAPFSSSRSSSKSFSSLCIWLQKSLVNTSARITRLFRNGE